MLYGDKSVTDRDVIDQMLHNALPLAGEALDVRSRAAAQRRIGDVYASLLKRRDNTVMPAASAAVRTEWDMALSAIAAGNAATLDVAEAMRGDMPMADNLRHRETAENLADSLRAVLAILHGAPPAYENTDQRGRYEDGCRLLCACQEYLEGWETGE
jgi:hypothetical protein